MSNTLDQLLVNLKHWLVGFFPGSWQSFVSILLSIVPILAVFPLLFNPIPVPDDRANVVRACQRGAEVTIGTSAGRIGGFDLGGRFRDRRTRAHKCHARCIRLHTAPLEQAGAAKSEPHETMPSVTFFRLSRASENRQGVSGR